MSFAEMALRMWPGWVLGLLILLLTFFSKNRSLIRVEKKAMIQWCKTIGMILGGRILMLGILQHFFRDSGPAIAFRHGARELDFIPWQAMLFVFWEDAVHVLPFIILKKMAETRKWLNFILYPLLVLVMLDFALGHSYEGTVAMIAMALYIPIMMHVGKKYGVGTVMIGHTMYDLTTKLAITIAMMI